MKDVTNPARTSKLLVVVLLFLAARADAQARQLEMDFSRDALSLNGLWQALLNRPDEPVYKPAVAESITEWQAVEVPKGQIPGDTWDTKERPQCVWLRRDFDLSDAQAARSAVLKWNGIRFGATVWVNGKHIDAYPNIGPHTILLPDKTLQPGRNSIMLKLSAWASLEKSQSGFPLVPTGSATQGWGAKTTGIYDDIWLEFYDLACAKHILAVPDLDANTVTFRITFDSVADLPAQIETTAGILLPETGKMAGKATVGLRTADAPAEITVKLDNVKPWTPRTPILYRAELSFSYKGRICDSVAFNFGMREIKVISGRYQLNGKPLRFHGSNLVAEWNWGDYNSPFNKETKRYIVDEARNMNLNSFRTHTLPPPTDWLDIADKYGTMFIAELPILYNYGDPNFTPRQWETFHKNALLDATAWVTKLWNHPSVMVWVLTNESNKDAAWEMGTLRDHVRLLDPTRPTLRTGEQTAEAVDLHPCDNFAYSTEGALIVRMADAAARKDPQRTLGNSEYMNIFGPTEAITTRWLGRHSTDLFRQIFAEFAAEHTEVMRRTDFDLILPYMYAGWTALRGNNWRPDFPTPTAAALHSAMAPIFASLDIFDRNFLAGSGVVTDLHLINETCDDVNTTVSIIITPKDPVYVPDPNALCAAISRSEFSVNLKADSHTIRQINWPVPKEPGVYYLAAVLEATGQRPVVSQRIIRSVAVDKPSALTGCKIVILGADSSAEKWLMANRISFIDSIPSAEAKADAILIWDARRITAADRARTADILKLVETGAHLVILDQNNWDWPQLIDFQIVPAKADRFGVQRPIGVSRVFPFPSADAHPMLRGIDSEFLKRWNGLPGTIADHQISGQMLEKAEKLLWGENQNLIFAATLKRGAGEIVLCQLQLKGRLDRESKRYDPVAEQILLNLLER